jgi:acyl-CoA synthetase (AMP-forming)/AMP-acid ligase II
MTTTLMAPPRRRTPRVRHASAAHALLAAAARGAATGITLLPERAGQPERHRSYRELYAHVRDLELELRSLGVEPGDRVLLVLPTSFEFVVAFFAVQYLGAIPVPSYPPDALRLEAGIERLAHIARRAEVKAILTTQELRVVGGDVALRSPSVRIVSVVAEPEQPPAWWQDAPPVADTVELGIDPAHAAFFQFTSGSTGSPKGVVLSHHAVTANIRAIGKSLRVRRSDVVVGWLPLYHDMGLIGTLLFAVYWQLPLVLMSPTAFLRQPTRWLWAIHHHRGTLSPAPNFAYGLCVRRAPKAEGERLDLSSWRVALNGAEPVNLRTLQAFEEMYAPYGFQATTMLPVYGLAEASLAVAFPQLGSTARHEMVDRAQLARGRAVPASGDVALPVVSVGRAVPGHCLTIVDRFGMEQPERSVGEIVFRGPSVMREYYRDREATAQALRNGWLHTGDLGYVADGELFVVGRAKDLIIVRGRNIYPEDVERTAEQVPEVRQGGAVAFGVYDEAAADERVVLVCETKVSDDTQRAALAERIKQAVGERHDLTLHQVVLVPSGTIPRTFSGKRQRSLCRDLYRRGELSRLRQDRWQQTLVGLRGVVGLALLQLRRRFRRARGRGLHRPGGCSG